ncbi:MAG: DUF559 domain-containing protein [Candidatus Aenigmarchaeota archaeon]|nr:DUF559 domain-containing protein [Candidatus Aenigmarchaeota archaeon]
MRRIDNATEKKAIELYREGYSTPKISKKLSISRSGIRSVLIRNNVKMREIHRELDEHHRKEILELYSKGIPITGISKRTGICHGNVKKVLKENNIKIKCSHLNSSLEKEITDLYQNGKSTVQISRKYGISHHAVCNALHRNNIKTRETHKKLSKEIQNQIASLYLDGLTITEIGKKLDISSSIVWSYLKTFNIKIRDQKLPSVPENMKESVRKEIAELYSKGYGTYRISKKLNISKDIVLKILHEKKIEIRDLEERKILMSQNMVRLLSTGSYPRITGTIPEKMLKEEFIKRGFIENKDFVHQYNLNNRFSCDFCFPKHKLIIECDGDYWHANPNKYGVDRLHIKQKKTLSKDKAKDRYIETIDNGSWTLLKFWESEIHKDVSRCVDKIEDFIKMGSKKT